MGSQSFVVWEAHETRFARGGMYVGLQKFGFPKMGIYVVHVEHVHREVLVTETRV